MIFKDTKITVFSFLPYECTAVEEYLEGMATKGWILKSVSNIFFTFKRIEPRKIKYSVDALHKISIFDSKDSEVALEYREFCKEAGWRFICQTNKVQIFISEEKDIDCPIHTDPEDWFKSVFKSSLYYVFGQLSIVIVFSLNIHVQLFTGSLKYVLSSNFSLILNVLMISLVAINFIQFVSFFSWVIRAKNKLKENEFEPYSNYKQLKRKNIVISVQFVLSIFIPIVFTVVDDELNFSALIIIFSPLLVAYILYYLINKYKFSREVNITIIILSTIIVFFLMMSYINPLMFNWSEREIDNVKIDEFNLTLRDFGVMEEDSSPYEDIQSSILAKRTLYIESFDDDSLNYTIFESKYNWVLNLYEDRLFNEFEKYKTKMYELDSRLSNDLQIYVDDRKITYIFISEDKVVEIRNDFSDISEDEFINKIYEKLFTGVSTLS